MIALYECNHRPFNPRFRNTMDQPEGCGRSEPIQKVVGRRTKVSQHPVKCEAALGNYLSPHYILREAGSCFRWRNTPEWGPVLMIVRESTEVWVRIPAVPANPLLSWEPTIASGEEMS